MATRNLGICCFLMSGNRPSAEADGINDEKSVLTLSLTLSRTLATNMGMGNAWLEKQGLISLKEQWSKIHYPA